MAAFDDLETYTEPKELISFLPHKGDVRSAERERRDLKRGSKEVRVAHIKFRGFESEARYPLQPFPPTGDRRVSAAFTKRVCLPSCDVGADSDPRPPPP
jgi:hypothetical protein